MQVLETRLSTLELDAVNEVITGAESPVSDAPSRVSLTAGLLLLKLLLSPGDPQGPYPPEYA